MRLAALCAVIAALPAAAGAADPCGGEAVFGAGPARATVLEAEHGLARRVCPRTEVGVAGGGYALIDTPDYYGTVRAAAQVFATYAAGEDTELFALVEVYRYQVVIASVSATHSGLGHTALGAAYRFWRWRDLDLGVTGRVVVPTAVDLYQNAWPFRFDAGVNVEWRPLGWLAVHGQAGALFTAAVSQGPVGPRGAAALTAGAAWQPFAWLALIADLQASFGYADALDVLASAFEVRLGLPAGLEVSLAAAVPMAGRERGLAAGSLRLGWVP